MKRILPLLILLLCAPLAGCPGQQATADLLIIAGNSVAAYCASQGNSDCADKAALFASKVSADVANFVPGTKSQDAIQAIQDFEGVISAADPDGKLAILDLALSTALSALQVIEANSSGTPPSPTPAVTARVNRAQTIAIQNPPKDAKAYKAQWNALLKASPVDGLKPLK